MTRSRLAINFCRQNLRNVNRLIKKLIINRFEIPWSLFFPSKVGDNERITLIEGDKVLSEDWEVAETFKSYFVTIVENLGINNKCMSEEPVSNESVNNIRKF